MLFCLLLGGGNAFAEGTGFEVPVKSIAQITFDDDGNRLGYPTAVFFDPTEDETYVVNGKTNRIVVYGPDFFPRESIGIGRGVVAPRGGTVLSNGEVYVCQISNFKNPSPRITILNGAFFVDREIFLDKIPEAKGFIPRQLAVSKEGTIYLAGYNERGILVLDNEGNFLRRLEPMDQISAFAATQIEEQQKAAEKNNLEDQEKQGGQAPAEAEGQESEEDKAYADIPEEFRPRDSQSPQAAGSGKVLGPVKVNYVTIDSTGRLYLLSEETGRVYVYGPDETLLFHFGQKGGSPGQLSQAKSVAVDNKRGFIYVADYMRHTIITYDLNGKFLFEVGGRGNAPGWFNFPAAVALNSQEQLIVADLFNKRVQVLDVEYEKSSQWLLEKEKKEIKKKKTETETSGEVTKEAEPEPEPPAEPSVESPAEPSAESPAEPSAESPAEPSAEPPAEPSAEQSNQQPDGAVKEVIIPEENLPAQPEANPEPEKAPEAPADTQGPETSR